MYNSLFYFLKNSESLQIIAVWKSENEFLGNSLTVSFLQNQSWSIWVIKKRTAEIPD